MNHDDLTELQQDLDNAKTCCLLNGSRCFYTLRHPRLPLQNGIYNGVQERPETILSESTLYNRPEFSIIS